MDMDNEHGHVKGHACEDTHGMRSLLRMLAPWTWASDVESPEDNKEEPLAEALR
eukprot:CAMPEP_0206452458 /NCGR_PEP_ID=MMETSP0324_2-20121206/19957_1 /ASSEMBLY_ACC=CAM_ASM_000836 /TAXON_ID=2866 /ORGANISM="Crypthecodinium cohnii, Strain Seligo" /LENGTH=53 /DNA_ID=CAMNT_0053922551 /DNA_START=103 /DNA_END=261 /DNA_ORIENTATION=-